jgi:hypothetical protein
MEIPSRLSYVTHECGSLHLSLSLSLRSSANLSERRRTWARCRDFVQTCPHDCGAARGRDGTAADEQKADGNVGRPPVSLRCHRLPCL